MLLQANGTTLAVARKPRAPQQLGVGWASTTCCGLPGDGNTKLLSAGTARGRPAVDHSAARVPAAHAGVSHVLSPSLWCQWVPRKLGLLSPGLSHQKLTSQEVAVKLSLHFSVVPPSSACCLLPHSAWGGKDRGAGADWLLWLWNGTVWECGTEVPSSSQHSAGRPGVLGRAKGCGERAGSAAGVAQVTLPRYFLPVLFPRAGAVRFGSWEGSPQGAGMIHRLN